MSLAMSAYDTSTMNEALPDVTYPPPNGNGALSHQQLRDAGWVERQAFNYDHLMAKPSEAAPPAAATDGNQAPDWAHNAAKYEWSEEYGDVGPKIPQLEDQLFRSEFLNRAGVKFNE
jgi:ATP-dependent RNA helicase DDX3X